MSKLQAKRRSLARLDCCSNSGLVEEGRDVMARLPIDKLTSAGKRNALREFCILDDLVRREMQGTLPQQCHFKPGRDFCSDVLPYREHCAQTLAAGYINASLMHSALVPGFIAAQGPLKSTVADFWSMVVNHGATQIVALCDEDECADYLPSATEPLSLLDGKLRVRLKSNEPLASGVLRCSRCELTYGGESWEVSRLHCAAWADEEVLPLPSLLSLAEVLNATSAKTTVVHCRAGAGRTGCLIALCSLLADVEKQLLKMPDSVPCASVARVVVDLRMRRPHMVQTLQQYEALYEALALWHQARGGTSCLRGSTTVCADKCNDETTSSQASTPKDGAACRE